MRTKFLKMLCLVLAVSVLVATSGMRVVALEENISDMNKINISAENVVLDGENDSVLTVTIVATAEMICYGMEGFWSLCEQGEGEYFTLTTLAFGDNLVVDSKDDNVSVSTGKVIWTDDDFDSAVTAKDGALLIATYSVDANTPAGDYVLTYTSVVFTDETGEPNETEMSFTATVHVHADATSKDHICDATDCMEVLSACSFADATCDTAKTCTICGATEGEALSHTWGEPIGYINNNDGTHTANYVCANDAEHVKAETVEHTFIEGACVCGASEIASDALLGDVNLDGVVDMEDVVSLMRHALQAEIITDSAALANGEVTNDAALDMNDVVKLMQYVLKAIDSLE